MKTVLTAATRPRIACGTMRRLIARRVTTLMPSQAPEIVSKTNDKRKFSDSPKKMIEIPKPATEICNSRPARRRGGFRRATIITPSDPSAGAALSNPNPVAPTFKISDANIGRSATAPPNRTANRSSAIEPTNIWFENTYLIPSRILCHAPISSWTGGNGRLPTQNMVSAE